jgi:lincosamide nucleotidyltransferase A/C/D/E
MGAADVVEILGWLGAVGADVWLDGGWVSMPWLASKREHKDLDLIVRDAHESRMREVLATHWFTQVRGVPQNFVLADERGREVDVHPVRFDDQGDGHVLSEGGEPFGHSAEAFAATGAFPDIASRVCPPKRRCRTIRGDTRRATPIFMILGSSHTRGIDPVCGHQPRNPVSTGASVIARDQIRPQAGSLEPGVAVNSPDGRNGVNVPLSRHASCHPAREVIVETPRSLPAASPWLRARGSGSARCTDRIAGPFHRPGRGRSAHSPGGR